MSKYYRNFRFTGGKQTEWTSGIFIILGGPEEFGTPKSEP